MLAIFHLAVALLTARLYCIYGAMLDRYKFHMAVAGDLEKEEAELLQILMFTIGLTAFTLFTLGGYNLLPNYF